MFDHHTLSLFNSFDLVLFFNNTALFSSDTAYIPFKPHSKYWYKIWLIRLSDCQIKWPVLNVYKPTSSSYIHLISDWSYFLTFDPLTLIYQKVKAFEKTALLKINIPAFLPLLLGFDRRPQPKILGSPAYCHDHKAKATPSYDGWG